jgi:hypothetical protein
LDVVACLLVGIQLVGFRAGLFASFLLAVSPLHLWYSQEARWYVQWSLLSTLSYLALLRACRRGTTGGWAVYGLCRLTSLYTFIMSVFVAVSQFVTVLWQAVYSRGGDIRSEGGRWLSVRRFIATNLVVAAAGAPVIWVVVSVAGRGSGTPRPASLLEVVYTFYAYAVGFSLGPSLAFLHGWPSLPEVLKAFPIVSIVAVVFALPLVTGTVSLLRRPDRGAVVLPWFVGPPLLMFVIGLTTNLTYEVRYTLAALPAFYLVVAAGVAALRPLPLRLVTATAVIACTLCGTGGYYWDHDYDKEDAKGSLAYVEAHGSPAAQVVAVGQILLALEYYGGARNMMVIECGGHDSSPARLDVATSVDTTREVWVAAGRDWDGATEPCLAWLSAAYETAQRRSFTGVELWRLVPRRSAAGGPGEPAGGT